MSTCRGCWVACMMDQCDLLIWVRKCWPLTGWLLVWNVGAVYYWTLQNMNVTCEWNDLSIRDAVWKMWTYYLLRSPQWLAVDWLTGDRHLANSSCSGRSLTPWHKTHLFSHRTCRTSANRELAWDDTVHFLLLPVRSNKWGTRSVAGTGFLYPWVGQFKVSNTNCKGRPEDGLGIYTHFSSSSGWHAAFRTSYNIKKLDKSTASRWVLSTVHVCPLFQLPIVRIFGFTWKYRCLINGFDRFFPLWFGHLTSLFLKEQYGITPKR